MAHLAAGICTCVGKQAPSLYHRWLGGSCSCSLADVTPQCLSNGGRTHRSTLLRRSKCFQRYLINTETVVARYEAERSVPAIEAIAADVKDSIVQELRLGVHQECQHILLVQAHLIGGQVCPQRAAHRDNQSGYQASSACHALYVVN